MSLLFHAEGDAIYTSKCLGLRQCVETVDSINMLDLVFENMSDLKLVPADSGLVTPDTYHPPFSIDVLLPHVNNLNSEMLSNILCRQLQFALQPSIQIWLVKRV
jgi:hypothetical protein